MDRHATIGVLSLNSVDFAHLDPGLPLDDSSLGRPTTVANGTIQLGSSASFQGGSLTYTGTGETTDRVLNMGGGGEMEQARSIRRRHLEVHQQHDDDRHPGTKTIELQGSTAGTGEMAGVIPNATTRKWHRNDQSGTGTYAFCCPHPSSG